MKTKPNIKDAHEYLKKMWPRIKKEFERTGHKLKLTCVYRTPEEQKELYAQGRTKPGNKVTWVDGFKKQSNHNKYPARAIDVVVLKKMADGSFKVTWNEAYYYPLIFIAEKFGLRSGGSWKRTKDFPHIELPKGA